MGDIIKFDSHSYVSFTTYDKPWSWDTASTLDPHLKKSSS